MSQYHDFHSQQSNVSIQDQQTQPLKFINESKPSETKIISIAPQKKPLYYHPNMTIKTNTPGKPPYSYATLITYAIMNSESRQMTLNEIYNWLMEAYPHFKTAGSGWKNSIRHNLSLNRSFVRVPRPISEPGKGAYWTVDLSIAQEATCRSRNNTPRRASDPGNSKKSGVPDYNPVFTRKLSYPIPNNPHYNSAQMNIARSANQSPMTSVQSSPTESYNVSNTHFPYSQYDYYSRAAMASPSIPQQSQLNPIGLSHHSMQSNNVTPAYSSNITHDYYRQSSYPDNNGNVNNTFDYTRHPKWQYSSTSTSHVTNNGPSLDNNDYAHSEHTNSYGNYSLPSHNNSLESSLPQHYLGGVYKTPDTVS